MDTILEIKNLEKDFKGFKLDKVSFSLERGYMMGFIGPNGAGKSTTIKLIMNLLKKKDGEVCIFGLDNIRNEREIKSRIGFVYEDNFYYEELTLLEMKQVLSRFYTQWDEKKFRHYLDYFQLPGKKKIKELSKGMKMKYALTIALSHNAELLILDEPTSGLDPIVRREFINILSSVIEDGNKAVFFSTHITSDLDKSADFITLIHNGRILFSQAKDDLLDSCGLVKGGKNVLSEENKNLFIGLKKNQFGFEGLVRDKDSVKQRLKDKFILEKPTLEDILYYFTLKNEESPV